MSRGMKSSDSAGIGGHPANRVVYWDRSSLDLLDDDYRMMNTT